MTTVFDSKRAVANFILTDSFWRIMPAYRKRHNELDRHIALVHALLFKEIDGVVSIEAMELFTYDLGAITV